MGLLSTERWGFPLALVISLCISSAIGTEIDLDWHAPAATRLNDLDQVLRGEGVYGFIYDTSETPEGKYGTYNWCNMPHVRREEYIRAPEEFELRYVEVVSSFFVSMACYYPPVMPWQAG